MYAIDSAGFWVQQKVWKCGEKRVTDPRKHPLNNSLYPIRNAHWIQWGNYRTGLPAVFRWSSAPPAAPDALGWEADCPSHRLVELVPVTGEAPGL